MNSAGIGPAGVLYDGCSYFLRRLVVRPYEVSRRTRLRSCRLQGRRSHQPGPLDLDTVGGTTASLPDVDCTAIAIVGGTVERAALSVPRSPASSQENGAQLYMEVTDAKSEMTLVNDGYARCQYQSSHKSTVLQMTGLAVEASVWFPPVSQRRRCACAPALEPMHRISVGRLDRLLDGVYIYSDL